MNQMVMEKQGRGKRADFLLTASILLLTGIGLVTLYSSSYAFAERFFGNGLHFIMRQLMLAGMGLVIFFFVSRINLDSLRKWMVPAVLGTMALMALTFVPGIGVMRNGAARWIRIGSSTYQPSELVKLVLPFYLAHIFGKKTERPGTFSSGVLPPALITVAFFLLIYFQNNFSTACFVLFNALFIFYLAGFKLRYFFGAAMIFLPLSAFFVLTREHRLRRFISFLYPDWDPQGSGYQVRLSLMTVSSGGFWGKGIGQGTRKIASVPEIHSDFIFAAFAEEAGFLGVILIFLIFGIFAFAAYRTAMRIREPFRRLLCLGLATTILSQALLNMAVVAGALPATGIPLPFFSAGGSSLATTLVMCALMVNASRYDNRGYENNGVPAGSTGIFDSEFERKETRHVQRLSV
ncbi:MAG: putative lipid II flippase FtsW [Treponema sp.]|jgi:cell division protein FtsW|nr:putative lipid II flippase FtsW [Treponema sp.]